ncbi:MAG: cupin domain-containing protein [Nitrospirae bacterium]|nr:cupin domain-containing protein [Nitrospirota bacterium]
MRTSYDDVKAYVTKDGSEIRELMHPAVHGNVNQSLAEATIPMSASTLLHKHAMSEELYHVISGKGEMVLGVSVFAIAAGDTVCIVAGTEHMVKNTGGVPLKILCCSSPPYSHDDTILL